MINWDEIITTSYCIDLNSEMRNLRQAAGCVAIIPKELDTPVLRKIRTFLSRNGIPPEQLLHDEYILKHLTPARSLIPTTQTENQEKAKRLQKVKTILYRSLHDSIYTTTEHCNQKLSMKKNYFDSSHTSYRYEPDTITNMPDRQPICTANLPLLKQAQALSDELNRENWDTTNIVKQLKKIHTKRWIRESAWDLTPEELALTPIDERLGIQKERGNKIVKK